MVAQGGSTVLAVFCWYFHDGVILLQLPEFISFSFSNSNFVIPVDSKEQSSNYHKKTKTRRILVVVVKWRHGENVLLSEKLNTLANHLKTLTSYTM